MGANNLQADRKSSLSQSTRDGGRRISAEVESEEPATDKGKTPTKKRAGRRVSTTTQDPEDDKLVGFPDVSFPSGN